MSVLLYVFFALTLTKNKKKKLEENNTRMLLFINSWQDDRWIHAFAKGISTNRKASSFAHDLKTRVTDSIS